MLEKVFFRKLGCICLMVMIIGLKGFAQYKKLGVERLTMAEGLSSNLVLDIMFDKKGYLWAATINGINRYDGYGFTAFKFDPNDSHSLNQNLVFSLFEDREGIIWAGTAEGGINQFDRSTEKFTNYKPDQPANRIEPVLRSVSAINEDREGMLWVGSASGELRRFNKQTNKFSDKDFNLGYQPQKGDLRPFDLISCIYRDKEGGLWVGNKSGLHELVISHVKTGSTGDISFKTYRHSDADPHSLSDNKVMDIIEDQTGDLWISTDSGLNRMNRKEGTFTCYFHNPTDSGSLSNNSLGKMCEDREGNLWITVDGAGICYLNKERNQFFHVETGGLSFGASYLGHLLVDKSGSIWIPANGISKLDLFQTPLNRFRYVSDNGRFPEHVWVNSMFCDHGGNLWFATNHGLDLLNNKTGLITHCRLGPGNQSDKDNYLLSDVSADGDGNLWASSCNGNLYRQDRETDSFKNYAEGNNRFKDLGKFSFNKLFKDSRNFLLIGTGSGGIIQFNTRTGDIRRYRHDPEDPAGICDYQTNCFCEDRQGFIWIGHGSVGTDRLNLKTNTIKHYQYHAYDSSGISSNVVNAIYKDSRGNLWFGTGGGGLCRYHDATDNFTTYTEKDGLPDNTISSIIEDDEGELWIGTMKGICHFSPGEQIFTNYDYPSSSKENPVCTFLAKSKQGMLYFRDGEGATFSLDPGKLRTNKNVPPLVITHFKLFNQPRPGLNEANKIILNHDQNFFSLEFAALNFTHPEKNQYAYKLEGVDKDWVYSGANRSANYTGIDPGSYIFRVKGSNNEGIWNEEGISVGIVIKPPWWRTWWAYTLYVFCGAVILFLAYRIYRNRLREKQENMNREKELEMQVLRSQMNPHFIFNCLSSINSFILENRTEEASDYLTKFSKLIRTVLNNSKKSLISLEDELEMLVLYLDMEMLRFRNAFTYNIKLKNISDPACVYIPPLLLQPFAENAIWHGLMHKQTGGSLEINLYVEKNILTCVISDNGVGRAFAKTLQSKTVSKHKSFGIQITRQRMSVISGTRLDDEGPIHIQDLYDNDGKAAGTRVSLSIKCRETIGDIA